MTDFLLAPLMSLFSLRFYRRLLSRRLASGFLYLGYLVLLLAISGLFLIQTQFLPAANDFVKWLKESLPELTVTREGIRMAVEEPLLLNHPRWGSILYLIPQKDFPDSEDLGKAFVVVTRTKIAYRDPRGGEVRIQDIIPEKGQKEWRDFRVTGEAIEQIWNRSTPPLAGILFGVILVGGYLWKLAAALVYSLIGLLLNRFRKERLPYRSILNYSFFVLTPVTLLQVVTVSFPRWPIPLNVWTGGVLTAAYLALAILGTQSTSAEGKPS